MSEPKYCCKAEHISRSESELYELEDKLKQALDAILEYRVENYGENKYRQALPQTFFMIMESYDTKAGRVAAKFFLNFFENGDKLPVEL